LAEAFHPIHVLKIHIQGEDKWLSKKEVEKRERTARAMVAYAEVELEGEVKEAALAAKAL
jgi:hypothetical protein